MWLSFVSPEFLTAMAVLALLVGVPLFVVLVIAVLTGYVQHDATQFLAELEEEEDSAGRVEDDR
ncbi:hypothetical protein [Halosolutus gelatinilyticus]|uniref:hypothetical protein n=1 Tax=Halosolutus gelatinilyticus TaxID=2931975 RepID=UPI001FF476E4|nr:hypothetical protein [Halosolutus gelatinilyticus]